MRLPTRRERVVHRVIGAVLTSRLGTSVHLGLLRATGGRIARTMSGLATVVLTTTGRRSGRAHDAPLTALDEGGRWVVIASNGGKDRPPAWLLNLRADPRAHLAVGAARLAVIAREATEAEHAELWPRIVARYRGYETYRLRTARAIPLVILAPALERPEAVLAGTGYHPPAGE